MKKTYLILFFSLLYLANILNAQEYYRGSIITLKNESLTGFIQVFDENSKIESISYKNDLDGPAKTYSPSELKSFNVNNMYFISAEVESVRNKRNNLDVVSKEEIQMIKEWAFLQVLVDGKKKLYYYTNQYRNENYYIEYNDKVLLLEYNIYSEKDRNRDYKIEIKKYQGQLKAYLKDCPKIGSKIDKTSYNKSQLINLFRDYYKCLSGESYIATDINGGANLTKPSTNGRLKFALMPGLLTNISNHDGLSEDFYKNAGDQVTIGISFAIRFEYFPSKVKRDFSIATELNRSFTSFNGYYIENGKNITNRYDWNLSFERFKLNLLPMYRFNFDKFSIYVNAGISAGINIANSKLTIKSDVISHGVENNYIHHESILDKDLIEISLIAGVGIQYWKLFLEFRYDSLNNIHSNGFSANFHGIHSFLGYRF